MISDRLRLLEARAIQSHALRATDLAVFRVLYASFVLTTLIPVAPWLRLAPLAFFFPPIGLAAMFTAPPPHGVIVGLNILLALFAALLLVGWRTGVASAGTGLTLLVLNSWEYSLGKINHDILLVVAPLVLGFSSWGRALSIDAARRPPNQPARTEEAWPVALLALLVGFAMFSAGLEKATSGWLNPQLRCTYGHLVSYHFSGAGTWAGSLALRIDRAWFWKGADWGVTLLELAFLPAALNRRSFCPILAIGALFHLGVLLIFDIQFAANVVVYGAFVRYSALPWFGARTPWGGHARSMATVVFVAALATGLVATLVGQPVTAALRLPLGRVILWVGAVAGAWYLLQIIGGRVFSFARRGGVSR